jgi:hypothetical protein
VELKRSEHMRYAEDDREERRQYVHSIAYALYPTDVQDRGVRPPEAQKEDEADSEEEEGNVDS